MQAKIAKPSPGRTMAKLRSKKMISEKEIHIIKGAPHTFREQKHLDEIKLIIKKWLEGFD
jgi:hypothetical protein